MNQKEYYTEEEAIQITIRHGYDGSEFNTKAWKDRGCLKTDRSWSGLVSKLETIFHFVEVEGKGKKRKYTLKEKRDIMIDRGFKYVGKLPSPEDIIVKNYVHQNLSLMEQEGRKNNYGLSIWAKNLGFIHFTKDEFEDSVKCIKDTYYMSGILYNPKEVVTNFYHRVSERNRNLLSNCLKWLSQEGKINVIENFIAVEADGLKRISNLDEYNSINISIKNFLEERGIAFNLYLQNVNNMNASDFMKKEIKNVEDFIVHKYDVKKVFKTYEIAVIEKYEEQEMSKNLFLKSFIYRLWKLILENNMKPSYKNSLLFWRRFNDYNSFLLFSNSKLSEHFDKGIFNYDLKDNISRYLSDIRTDMENQLEGNADLLFAEIEDANSENKEH